MSPLSLWLFLASCFAIFSPINAQVIISEVYANHGGGPRDYGKEWFEVYNIGYTPIDLTKAVVRRLDGTKQEESWRIQLPEVSLLLAPQQYAIIAQKADLGIGVCLNTLVIVVTDMAFHFKKSGSQTLCIQTIDKSEDCAPFSNSIPFPAKHSRYNKAPSFYANDDLKKWQFEDCEVAAGVYASPGTIGGFCHMDNAEIPQKIPCPIENIPAQKLFDRNQHISCSCVTSKSTSSTNLFLVFVFLFLFIIRSKTDAPKPAS